MDAEEAADRLYYMAERLLPSGTDEERLRLCVAYGCLLEDFIEAGAEYAAFCALDMDGERQSTASLAMYRLSLEGYTATDLLGQTASALREAYPQDDIRCTDLPCGRVVVRIGDEPFLVPSEFSGTGFPVEMVKGVIQVYTPSPEGSEVIVLELTTPAMDDWDFYSELFASVVQTMNWSSEDDLLFLTTPSQAFRPGGGSPTASTQEIYEHSSNVLDALAMHGSVSPENRLSQVVCPDCRAVGNAAPCSLLHEWSVRSATISDSPTEAMRRAETALLAHGWNRTPSLTTADPSFSAVHAAGYRLGLTPFPADQRLLVKVLGPCRRPAGAPAGYRRSVKKA
ncbi:MULTISPECIES: hypothetical protein [Streptomyces]|uniref:hypothetical protein n=1 Tax=Streptomyces TaxID=1883 RepID=UPI00163D33D5|nr:MULTISPECIES: hypothetical protein [Streptomyces]MBC2877709.1 hypothetical protein [Streptomyces sp. TYQ1024]UBI38616.1 hypothetical protein K7I03_20560 [Streptomyces mobaraensis]UKW31198.1 hypothetical protein MCU78_20515 [Streptomyces sp. TYQ1024]